MPPLRPLLVAVLVAALCVAAIGLWLATTTSRERVTVVVPPFIAEYVATYGVETGAVREPGVELAIQHCLEFNHLMMGLKADMGFMSTEALAVAIDRGVPLKAVSTAVIQGAEMGNALIFVRSDSDIESPSQLVGRRMGVPWPKKLKSSNMIMVEVLERVYNVTIDLDSPLIIEKPVPQLPALLDRGEVDAVLVIGDVAAWMTLHPERYRLICDVSSKFKELYGEYPVVAVLAVKEDLLARRPELVLKALRLLNRSLHYGFSPQRLDEALKWALERRGEVGGESMDVARECLRQYRVCYSASARYRELVMEVIRMAYEHGAISRLPSMDEVFAELRP